MIILIIAIVALLVPVSMFAWDAGREEGIGLAVLVFVASSLIGGMVLALGLGLVGLVTSHNHNYEKNLGPLKAIEVTHETSAHYSSFFFIASGSVSGKAVYYFYGADGPGYRLQHIDADQAIIVETDAAPHIGVYCNSDVAVSNLLYPGFSFRETGCKTDTEFDTYVFYVPKGSITTSIKLGLP